MRRRRLATTPLGVGRSATRVDHQPAPSKEPTYPRYHARTHRSRRRKYRGHRGRVCSDNPRDLRRDSLLALSPLLRKSTGRMPGTSCRLRLDRHRRRRARHDHRTGVARKIRGVLVGRVCCVQHGGICLVSPLRHRRLASVWGNAVGDADGGDLRRRSGRDHADRKSTRLNSSHLVISYAVFCLKKKKHKNNALRGCYLHLFIPHDDYAYPTPPHRLSSPKPVTLPTPYRCYTLADSPSIPDPAQP